MRARTRAAAAALAAAALSAAAPAAAFVRTTDARTGVALAWRFPVVPWHVNRSWPNSSPSCQAGAAGDPALAALQASFAEWQQPCSNLEFVYGGELAETRTGGGGTNENVVVFRSGWCSQHPAIVDPGTKEILDPCLVDPDVDCGALHNCFEDPAACRFSTSCSPAWSVVALTSVLYDPASGRIIDADIEVNGWDGEAGALPSANSLPQHGWYFTCYADQPGGTCGSYGQADCASMDLQNTVTHEVGHFLGLRHPCTTDVEKEPDLPSCTGGGAVPYAVRTMSPTTEVRELEKRDLSPDDLAGVCEIYPRPEGGCGCGGGEGAGALSLLALALAARRRRPQDTISPA